MEGRRETDVRAPGEHDRVVVLNPVSGSANHGERVYDLARQFGYEVRETSPERSGFDVATDAIQAGASAVVAAGGDGTLNEVVAALYEADALADVEFGVIPAGTGNNFAKNVGIEGIEEAFTVLDRGERRTIDLGIANGRPFLNSCVCGLTADASAKTTSEEKRRLGVLAYVIETLRGTAGFTPVDLHIDAADGAESWAGPAYVVLVGNARGFPSLGGAQADVEDGLLDVTVVEAIPPSEAVANLLSRPSVALDRLQTSRMKTSRLTVEVTDQEAITFSLDGEVVSETRVGIEVVPRALTLPVGEGYDPDPETRS
ncbi:diacylglycerol/lipid kinase family protein [Natronorarus salvus]|uniref:diacylglycerol/lipid kinase family protein n=1 Tax=Natronorarus salvus TaxID=3117733 RepID=UPI002F2609C2